jgi:SAM-dependent methyltransferase
MGIVYDSIGTGYTLGRREDPRIAAQLAAALGDSGPVVNVGAGTGSYEPSDRDVVAVEPSAVMIAQRPPHAAPAVRAAAEALPFADRSFGAAMAVLTIHHWTDKPRGLAELRRVARGPVVIFSGGDRALNTSWWLHDYFPTMRELVFQRSYLPERIAEVLGPVELIPVPIPADCADGFEAAYWRRPEAILDPAVWQATSALSLISDADRDAGMRRLAADLDRGEWDRRYGHLRSLSELDLGYRIIYQDGHLSERPVRRVTRPAARRE